MTDFLGEYEGWRNNRFGVITNLLGLDTLKNKTLLELGCGRGHLGKMFNDIGMDVTCVDARPEHIDRLRELFPELADKSYIQDLNKGLGTDQYFDVILNTGVLYHLENVEENIKQCVSQCDILILETEVCDSDDEHKNLIVNEYDGFDQSYTLIGSRPSPAYVERILKECGIEFTRIIDSNLNHHIHNYTWTPQNDSSYRDGLRAFWICKKK